MTSQLDYQVALGKETVFKTPVTPDRAFLAGADHSWSITRTDAEALRPGTQVQRVNRTAVTKYEGSATVAIEAETKGLGFLLEAILGTVTSTAITDGFQQVHTLKTSDWLNSYTLQVALPTLGGGAVQPYTYAGAVASKWSLSAAAGQLVKSSHEFVTSALSTATAAIAPSYPAASDLFSFVGGTIGYAGTLTPPTTTVLASLSGAPAANVRDVSLSVDRGLDSNGWNLGGNGTRTRPPSTGKATIECSITAEYTDNTLAQAYLQQTTLPVVLTFLAPDGVSTLQVVLPACKANGELPKSNGGDAITQSVPLTVYQGVGVEPIYVVYRTTDTAP